MRSVGIDIGSASVKVAEVVQSKKAPVLLRLSEFPLKQIHDLHSGHNQDPENLGTRLEILEILKTIAATYQDGQTRLIAGLRQEMVSVRHKTFPFFDRFKILKSLPFELEEDLPFSLENAIYEAKIIRTRGPSAEVLACVTPKYRISEVLSKMQEAGLDISVLSCEGLALANCWEQWDAPPLALSFHPDPSQLGGEEKKKETEDIQILLDIGHTRTLVCAFHGDVLLGIHSIFWGGKSLAEVIVQRYEVPFAEALNILQGKAFILLNQNDATYDQVVFSNAITDGLGDMIRDVQLTLLGFQGEYGGKISHISISGGLSGLPNLNAYLTQAFDIPVNPVPPLGENHSLSGRLSIGPFVDSRLGLRCGIAIGLAIEGFKKPRNPAVNFLKNEFQRRNRKYQILWETWGGAVKLATAVFIIFFIYSLTRDQITSALVESAGEALKQQAKSVAKLAGKQANEEGVRRFLKERKVRAREAKEIQNLSKMTSALDILKKISEAVPGRSSASVWLYRFDLQGQKVEIEGTVDKPQDILSLQTALSQLSVDGRMENMKPSIEKSHPVGAGTPFAFKFNVDREITDKASDSVHQEASAESR